nr:STAS domain-containing protein [Alphaproteobacteria bacterium]
MRPIASVMAGALIACWIFFLCISIAVVMLGALAPHLVPYGIGMSLSCAIFLMVSYTIFAPARSKMIAVPTIISAVMLSAILADVLGVFTDLAIVTSLDRMLLSFVAFATIFIGVAFLVLRFTSLGNVARYIPLPVMNGFLLAVIWIGFKGVIDYSTGHDDAFASLASFTDIFTVEISNGIILCVALMFASQFFRAHRVLPLLLLFVIYVDYFIVNFAVTDSVSSDYQKTWLANLDSIPFNTSAIFNISELPRQVFNATIPDLLAMSLILFILSIYFASLYTSSLARSQLTAPAVGNFLAGVLGNGPPGISSRITHGVLNTRGVSFRVATVTAACILVVAAFWGHHFLAIVPVYIAYGVSLYMLSDLLFNWILANVTKSKLIDTSLAASIGFISIAYGFQVSIPVGTVLSAIIFVRQYSRVTVFRTIFDCTWFHSSTDYSEAEFQTLQAKGKSVIGFILQNFLFYGAEHQLLSRIQKDIDDVDSEVEIILLDFTNVQGFDSTVFIGFQNFFNLINVLGAQLVLTGLSDRVQQTMLQSIAP